MEKFISFLNSGPIDITKSDIKDSVNYIDEMMPVIIGYGKRILIALFVLFIGRKLIKYILKLFKKFLEKFRLEISVTQFLIACVKVALEVLVIIFIIDQILGFQTTSFVALIGSAGLTIGLALQGSLANFAGGVLILVAKPYKVGDYIIENANNNEGTVTSIDIFYTRLLTVDNKMIVIPNGTISNSSIINVTNEEIRRLDILIPVHYLESMEKVKNILNQVVDEQESILQDRDKLIYINNFEDSAITIGVRVWVKQENYWKLRCDILEKIKKLFDDNNIIFPVKQFDVNIKQK